MEAVISDRKAVLVTSCTWVECAVGVLFILPNYDGSLNCLISPTYV